MYVRTYVSMYVYMYVCVCMYVCIYMYILDTAKPEPTCTGLNYWKAQHVPAARKHKPQTI